MVGVVKIELDNSFYTCIVHLPPRNASPTEYFHAINCAPPSQFSSRGTHHKAATDFDGSGEKSQNVDTMLQIYRTRTPTCGTVCKAWSIRIDYSSIKYAGTTSKMKTRSRSGICCIVTSGIEHPGERRLRRHIPDRVSFLSRQVDGNWDSLGVPKTAGEKSPCLSGSQLP